MAAARPQHSARETHISPDGFLALTKSVNLVRIKELPARRQRSAVGAAVCRHKFRPDDAAGSRILRCRTRARPPLTSAYVLLKLHILSTYLITMSLLASLAKWTTRRN